MDPKKWGGGIAFPKILQSHHILDSYDLENNILKAIFEPRSFEKMEYQDKLANFLIFVQSKVALFLFFNFLQPFYNISENFSRLRTKN